MPLTINDFEDDGASFRMRRALQLRAMFGLAEGTKTSVLPQRARLPALMKAVVLGIAALAAAFIALVTIVAVKGIFDNL